MRYSISRMQLAALAGLMMSAEAAASTGGGTPAGVDPAVLGAKLSEYDIHFLVDQSGSMTYDDPGKTGSRWARMEETMVSMAHTLAKIDTDGLDITFFSGAEIKTETGVQAARVHELFRTRRPGGSTPLTEGLAQALTYAGKSPKKDLIVCFTDGAPDDKPSVEKLIREQAGAQEADDDCTILFIQVGSDAAATTFLEKLDDGLTGVKFDIVDKKTQTEVDKYSSIEALLLDAITG